MLALAPECVEWQDRRVAQGSRQVAAVLALEDVVLFDAAIPWQVLRDAYEVVTCGVVAGPVRSTSGVPIDAAAGLEALERADLVLVPGFSGPVPDPASCALRAAHARGARVASICTGAFALAAAGLLDGRRATTHWSSAAELAARFPRVEVDPDVLWVDEGDVLTSAGVAAGIDLCMHLLRGSHGAAAANAAARRMVVAPLRDGGQAQFVDRPAGDDVPGGSLAATRAWALERLAEPITVGALAAHAGWSERSLARRWFAETGRPPVRWLHEQRVAAARELLETTDLPVEEVARRCGFGTAVSLRAHFHRVTRCTPSAYRRSWLSASGTG